MDNLLSTKEAAQLLAKSEDHVRHMAQTGKLVSEKVNESWVFLESNVQRYIKENYTFKSYKTLTEDLAKQAEKRYTEVLAAKISYLIGDLYSLAGQTKGMPINREIALALKYLESACNTVEKFSKANANGGVKWD